PAAYITPLHADVLPAGPGAGEHAQVAVIELLVRERDQTLVRASIVPAQREPMGHADHTQPENALHVLAQVVALGLVVVGRRRIRLDLREEPGGRQLLL